MEPSNPSQKVQDYKFVRLIGTGNYAEVFLAVDSRTQNYVAIKKIKTRKESLDEKVLELLQSEIQILKQIRNENVVRLITSFLDKGHYFLVFEYCSGGDAEKYVMEKKCLKEEEAILFFKQLLNGFKAIHDLKVIHRDFKLENILMHEGILKIADFGFCKQIDLARTIAGTGYYMAPEIMMNRVYTNKVDIWSLGVSLYRMLFGAFPFRPKEETKTALMAEIKANKIDFNYKGQVISEQMKHLISKMLIADPNVRIDWKEIYNHPVLNKEELQCSHIKVISKNDLKVERVQQNFSNNKVEISKADRSFDEKDVETSLRRFAQKQKHEEQRNETPSQISDFSDDSGKGKGQKKSKINDNWQKINENDSSSASETGPRKPITGKNKGSTVKEVNETDSSCPSETALTKQKTGRYKKNSVPEQKKPKESSSDDSSQSSGENTKARKSLVMKKKSGSSSEPREKDAAGKSKVAKQRGSSSSNDEFEQKKTKTHSKIGKDKNNKSQVKKASGLDGSELGKKINKSKIKKEVDSDSDDAEKNRKQKKLKNRLNSSSPSENDRKNEDKLSKIKESDGSGEDGKIKNKNAKKRRLSSSESSSSSSDNESKIKQESKIKPKESKIKPKESKIEKESKIDKESKIKAERARQKGVQKDSRVKRKSSSSMSSDSSGGEENPKKLSVQRKERQSSDDDSQTEEKNLRNLQINKGSKINNESKINAESALKKGFQKNSRVKKENSKMRKSSSSMSSDSSGGEENSKKSSVQKEERQSSDDDSQTEKKNLKNVKKKNSSSELDSSTKIPVNPKLSAVKQDKRKRPEIEENKYELPVGNKEPILDKLADEKREALLTLERRYIHKRNKISILAKILNDGLRMNQDIRALFTYFLIFKKINILNEELGRNLVERKNIFKERKYFASFVASEFYSDLTSNVYGIQEHYTLNFHDYLAQALEKTDLPFFRKVKCELNENLDRLEKIESLIPQAICDYLEKEYIKSGIMPKAQGLYIYLNQLCDSVKFDEMFQFDKSQEQGSNFEVYEKDYWKLSDKGLHERLQEKYKVLCNYKK